MNCVKLMELFVKKKTYDYCLRLIQITILLLPISCRKASTTFSPPATHIHKVALEPATNPDPSKLVWVQPGTFLMGSPTNEPWRMGQETQHQVTLTQGFYIGIYLVTRKEYADVIGHDPSNHPGTNVDRCPVTQVQWFHATNYCARRTQQEQEQYKIPPNWAYRLPTEAEWEYACRAGSTTAFYCGNALSSAKANFDGQYEYDASRGGQVINTHGAIIGHPTEVGSYQTNDWGLYDMCGNVWEWCQDWYAAYPLEDVSDPTGPTNATSQRVIRGGSWKAPAAQCRSAFRNGQDPKDEGSNLDEGFRVVLAHLRSKRE
jgi:formylglycine-generating enzyme required for sulfatase activity